MKKTLIAMAVLAASGASMAQVTLYGVVGAGFQNQKQTSVAAGVSSDTRADGIVDVGAIGGGRFGMMGTEDLGGGLKANFQLEATANTSTGNTTGSTTAASANFTATGINQLFNRQSWVGLSGGFGAVQLGRTSSPFTDVVAASDVFETTGIRTVNLDDQIGGTRQSSGVFYTTPNSLGGFVVKAMYATLDTGVSTTTAAGVTTNAPGLTTNTGLRVGYAAGPLVAHVGMGVLDTTSAAGISGRTDGQAISVSYDFGAAKLFAGAAKIKSQGDVGVDSYATNTESNIGVSVPVGAITLMGAIGRNSRTTVATGVENSAATGTGGDWALGAYYNFSKRTVAYMKTGVFNKLDLGLTATTGTTNRQETSATTIGIRHSF